MNSTTLPDREKELAQQTVNRFVRRFEESYRLLAYHAALPLVLTPELLNYLRNRFLRGQVPWVAEVDLLLSDLCSPVGYELYAMDTAVRAHLLDQMQQELGTERMQEVARLLLNYVRYLSRTNPFVGKHELEAQRWAAMVYLDDQREKAAQEILQAFHVAVDGAKVNQSLLNQGEMVRLARITQELAPQLKAFPILISYAELVSRELADSDITESKVLQPPKVLATDEDVADEMLEQNLDEIKELIARYFSEQDNDFEMRKPPKDIAADGIDEITIASDGHIGVNITNKSLDSIHEDYFDFSLYVKITFSIEVSYFDYESFVPESDDGDVPHTYIIIPNQIVNAIAKVKLSLYYEYNVPSAEIDDIALFPSAEIDDVVLNVEQPILVLDTRISSGFQESAINIQEDVTQSPQASGKVRESEDLSTSTRMFDFDVVIVNSRGQEVERHRGQARFFSENLGNGISLEMVAIPGGSFHMGAPETELDWVESESPQHLVTVAPFFIAKYPITQAQWKAVASLPLVNRDLKQNPSQFKRTDRPVEKVSWHDAIEFCARLSKKTGRSYRLPNEAEWEYACRAGTITPFHFGKTINPDLVNYDGRFAYGSGSEGAYRGRTNPVGNLKVANDFGLYDMHGNVFEWCADPWHENYEGAPINGAIWEDGGDDSFRLVRGGSWNSIPRSCRSACRVRYKPNQKESFIGIRVVCASA
jgi:formylglycine-generating enzyme required for sulfatase activity